MRVGISPAGKQLAFQRLLSSDFHHCCPVCDEQDPETLSHLFFQYPRWNRFRDLYIAPCFSNWGSIVHSPTAQTLAVGVLLRGDRGVRVEPPDSHNQAGGHMTSTMPVAAKNPKEATLATSRFLAGLTPIRKKLVGRKLTRNTRMSSRNQGRSGTVALAEP